MTAELHTLDATALAAVIASGEVTSSEVVEQSIARLEAADAQFNFLVTEQFDEARDRAAQVSADVAAPADAPAPFAGVPIVLKDLGAAEAAHPYWCGSRYMQRVGFLSTRDDSITELLRGAGFITLGRTSTPEFGLDTSTEPASTGAVKNPWDVTRSAGGSSGGSAAAVATRAVPVAHANDAGGSIRIPASFGGLVGLKPTRGRVSMSPGSGDEWGGISTEGMLTRSVRDAASLLDLLSIPMPGDPHIAPRPARPFLDSAAGLHGRSLRIGFVASTPASHDPAARCDADVTDAVTAAALLLQGMGHRVDEQSPANLFDPLLPTAMAAVISANVALMIAELAEFLGEEPRPDDLEAGTWLAVEEGTRHDAMFVQRCMNHYNVYTRDLAAWWGDPADQASWDVLMTPTYPRVAPALRAENASTSSVAEIVAATPFTVSANVSGLPAISLPLGRSATGVPIGVQFIGRFGREDELLALAADLEQLVAWGDVAPQWELPS